MKRIGIFGGTFDPIHNGHLITAQSVLHQRNLDEIVFIPCFISPHKTDKTASSPVHRLNMVKLAIENHPKFVLSDYELKKEGISFTRDTITHFHESYKDIELIIGYDSFSNFETWKDPEEIIKLAKLIVMKRSYNNMNSTTNKFFNNALFVDTPVIDISSTEIREKIQSNIPIDFLLPDKVLQYINDNRLYK